MTPRDRFLIVLKGMSLYMLATAMPAWAQHVRSDETLSTQVSSSDNLNFVVTGGDRAGGNLFHSFEQFSVPTGGSALFNNAPTVRNILARITGTSASTIDGLIQTNGTANLFLINPRGIIFGPNARLDIGGSFVASTATSLNFVDGTSFSARPSNSPPLLSINVPAGLQYGNNPGEIRVEGAELTVQRDRTLALIGGRLSLNGASLIAAGGRIDLGSMAGPGAVALSLPYNQPQFRFSGETARANLSLVNNTLVSTSSQEGGAIHLAGRRIVVQDSRIEATTLGDGAGGNLTVSASDAVEISGGDRGGTFSNGLFTETRGNGDAGDLRISTQRLIVRGETRVSAATFGAGEGGDLTVNATHSVDLIGIDPPDDEVSLGTLFTGLLTDTEGAGNAGNLTINTARLRIRNGAQASATTFASGSGGDLIVNASEAVTLIGVTPSDLLASGLFTAVQPTATGRAGDLTINTQRLTVRDGAQVFAGTFGAGRGGNLTVRAIESVELRGASPSGFPNGLFTAVQETATGNGGNLTVNTERLTVSGGAQIFAGTLGTGNGGNLTVTAADIETSGVSPDGTNSGLFSSTDDFLITSLGLVAGRAGSLTINTNRLTVRDGAQVAASTFGNTRGGGNLLINALQSIDVSGPSPDGAVGGGTGILSGTPLDISGTGDSGNITINTQRLTVQNQATVGVNNQGTGNAGNLTINADSILLNQQGIFTAATTIGEGGNIRLNVQNVLLMRDRSLISAEAGETGNGGNIAIEADFLVALENSDIIANAEEGRGGRINITTSGVLGTQITQDELIAESEINARSRAGIDGTVEIRTPEVDPAEGLAVLPQEVVDASTLVSRGCGAEQTVASEFVVTGRGGLPLSPQSSLGTSTVLADLGHPLTSTSMTETRNSATHSLTNLDLQPEPQADLQLDLQTNSQPELSETIAEAQGWVMSSTGEVVLTGYAPTVTPYHSWTPQVACYGS